MDTGLARSSKLMVTRRSGQSTSRIEQAHQLSKLTRACDWSLGLGLGLLSHHLTETASQDLGHIRTDQVAPFVQRYGFPLGKIPFQVANPLAQIALTTMLRNQP